MTRPLAGLLILLAAAAGVWWYFAPHTLPVTVRHTVPVSPKAQDAAPVLYKWRDAGGRLNVTDVPPAGRAYQTVRYDPDTNLVPGYRRPETAPGSADARPIPPDPAKKSN